MITLYPSLMASNQLTLHSTLDSLDPYADGYHIDIMDHHFVPNLMGSPGLIHAIAKQTKQRLWIHLMVDRPELWPPLLHVPEETMISIHIEATKDPLKLIHTIQRRGWQAGIALKPHTPVNEVYPLLQHLDHLLIMAVEPGFSGQAFLETTHQKIATALSYKQAHNLALHIAIDGGVTKELLPTLAQAGVDALAIGAALFATGNPTENLQALKQML